MSKMSEIQGRIRQLTNIEGEIKMMRDSLRREAMELERNPEPEPAPQYIGTWGEPPYSNIVHSCGEGFPPLEYLIKDSYHEVVVAVVNRKLCEKILDFLTAKKVPLPKFEWDTGRGATISPGDWLEFQTRLLEIGALKELDAAPETSEVK